MHPGLVTILQGKIVARTCILGNRVLAYRVPPPGQQGVCMPREGSKGREAVRPWPDGTPAEPGFFSAAAEKKRAQILLFTSTPFFILDF
jgi:hypothetical protein